MEAHKIEQATDEELARCLEAQPERFGPDSLRALAARVVDRDRALDWLDELGLLEAFERGESLPGWMSLDDFLNSRYWDEWRESIYSNMPANDQERFGRVVEAAEHGAEGSTHAEILEDEREALEAYAKEHPMLPGNLEALLEQIDSAERWHERAGTLDEQVG